MSKPTDLVQGSSCPRSFTGTVTDSTGAAGYGGTASANEILLDGTPTTLPERQGTNSVVVNATT